MLTLIPSAYGSGGELITLLHPRTNQPTPFLLQANNRLFETEYLVRGSNSDGSFFVGSDSLFHSSRLRIFVEFDPFFFILQFLKPEELFMDYFDIVNKVCTEAGHGMTKLLQQLNSSSSNFRNLFVENFFDEKFVCHRQLLRLNREKISSFLTQKLDAIHQYLLNSNVHLVECGSIDPRTVALEILRNYITEQMYEEFSRKIGLCCKSAFDNNNSIAISEEKKNAKPPTQPGAKKVKEIPIAKSCMKMTAFFKPAH